MKLTQDQIAHLYKFTREHYVYHYDLQTELVDHLSNGIEDQWQENPHLTFKEALNKEFKKFGIFGFMDVIEKKTKAMQKRYRGILWRFLKEWFKLPKVITTLLIFLTFVLVMQLKYANFILMAVFGVLIIFDLRNLYKNKKKEKLNKEKEKIFMLEAMLGTAKQGNGAFNAVNFVNVFNFLHLTDTPFEELQLHWVLLIAVIATLACLTYYITNYVMPTKAQELLEETYPEYRMVN